MRKSKIRWTPCYRLDRELLGHPLIEIILITVTIFCSALVGLLIPFLAA